MTDPDDEPTESPATWENVVVGKAKELFGHLTGNKELTQEGEDQEEIAHDVDDEFKEDDKD